MSTVYSAGLMFSQDYRQVVLINKKRPAWQLGKWNGIGGHLEPGELPQETMRREFMEETGVNSLLWERFATTKGDGWIVHWFTVNTNDVFKCKTMTDEHIGIFPTQYVLEGRLPTVNHIKWLMHMALPECRPDWPFWIEEKHVSIL